MITCDEKSEQPQGGGVEVGGGHEGVQNSSGHRYAASEGESVLQLDIVGQVELVLVQVPDVGHEGEVQQDVDSVHVIKLNDM